jgi:TetR/AcrR family transcriptional regulator
MAEDLSTEQLILSAAREVFMEKGMAGSRMQEIADKAGINKAMLHYYFRNKEKLFEAIFNEALRSFFPRINEMIESDLSLYDKIRAFIATYMEILTQNPYLPAFVIHEVNRDPQWFVNFIKNQPVKPNPEKLISQVMVEVKAGNIRPINPLQLVVNMFSLSIFPFLARPMITGIFGMDEKNYKQFIDERKTEVAEFIINAIKVK